MTKEQQKISGKNNRKAREFFKAQPDWVLHHIDPTWKETDIERYIQWNIEDLVMMTRSDHQKWHMNNLSESYYKTMSDACEGEKNGFYGKTHSDETKRKMSESAKHRKSNKQIKLTKQQRIERYKLYKEKYADLDNNAEIARKLTEEGYNTCKSTVRAWKLEEIKIIEDTMALYS